MEQLLELARRLGRQIAAHERTVLLKKAQEAADQDPQATELVKAYHAHMEKIHKLEEARQPVEVADKHRLQDLEQQISMNPALKDLSRRQVDFVEMMRKVKQSIDGELDLNP